MPTSSFSAGSASSCFSWGIFDGAAGHGSQVRGLCAALGETTCCFEGMLRSPWSLIPNRWLPRNPKLLQPREEWGVSPPQVLATCGRQAAAVSLILRARWQAKPFSIHLQHPQADVSEFDLVVVPEHDGLSGRNVITTRGALHPLAPAVLKETAAAGPVPGLQELGLPFTAVLLGGPNRYFPFTRPDVQRLSTHLFQAAADGHRLAIIPSRRTPEFAVDRLKRLFADTQFVWDGRTENPYRSALSLASHVVVTGDSISMISEANATGRPVYVEHLDERRPARKFRTFHQLCRERGLIRPFSGVLDEWTYEPLFEAGRIAELVRERLGNHAVRAA